MNKLIKDNEKLDILFICNSLNLGGAEKIMYEIIENIRSYKKEIICLTIRGNYSKLLENAGIKITYLNLSRNPLDLFKIFRAYLLILKKKPKIIHSFLYHSDVIGSILGKLTFTNKILWSVHSDFIKSQNTFLRNIQVKFLSKVSNYIPNQIIFCSKESLDNHLRIGYCRKKSLIIENGVCTKKFYPREKKYYQIRNLLGLKEDDSFLIGHIARFHPIKGHNLLLDSLKLLKKKNKNFKCLMIGTDINKRNESLKKQIKRNDLEENIILYGETKFAHIIINAFDINIISSFSESSSLVLMEAMASGIPSLATDVGPISRTMGQTGWVVKNNSAKDLADKLSFIIQNKQLLRIKSIAARERIITISSKVKMLKKYNLTYEKFLKKK